MDALEGADAAVIVTEWPEFAELDLAEVKEPHGEPVIVDGRNMLDAERGARRRVRLRGHRPV